MELENRLAELENIITTNSSEEVIIEYNNCKSDLETLYNYTGYLKKKYTSLKSCIFVLRTDKSLTFVSFVRQELNLNFET